MQIIDDLESKVRVDRCRAQTEQHRKVVRITSGTSFHENIAVAAQTVFYKTLMDGAGRQCRVHWQLVATHIPIGQNDNNHTICDCFGYLRRESYKRRLQVFILTIIKTENLVPVIALIELKQLTVLDNIQYRPWQDHAVGLCAGFLKNVVLAANQCFQ